jgi:hypothetical protein
VINNLFLRHTLEGFLRAVKRETVPEEEAVWPSEEDNTTAQPGIPGHFDNTVWEQELGGCLRKPFYKASAQLLPFKGLPWPRDPAKVTHICTHQTAVSFGVSSRRVKFWRKQLSTNSVAGAIVRTFVPSWNPEHLLSDDQVEHVARRIALHERFWVVPYHVVALQNGDLLHNNGFRRYTYHGSSANAHSLGVAMEGAYPARPGAKSVLTDFQAHTMQQALRLAVLKGREMGMPLTHVTAHRCYSKTRYGDPGWEIWEKAVIPVTVELDLKIDFMHKRSSGRPIPIDWDTFALFDWKGKRVA